ncbi:MAG: hypothetical protein UHU21_01925, partial [Lachnospiraceae bacterium]|nr:hypothetical protein [Lachnospiraceae bacterium]
GISGETDDWKAQLYHSIDRWIGIYEIYNRKESGGRQFEWRFQVFRIQRVKCKGIRIQELSKNLR